MTSLAYDYALQHLINDHLFGLITVAITFCISMTYSFHLVFHMY